MFAIMHGHAHATDGASDREPGGLSLGHYVYVLVFFQAMHTPYRIESKVAPNLIVG